MSPLSRCSACAAACPRDALTLGRGAPAVASSCDDCGVCGARCPTGAIDALDVPLATASVACAFADHPADERVPCLAALSLPVVAAGLSRSQGLHLIHARCEDCPRKRATAAVKALLQRTRLLAAALGLRANAVAVSTAAAKTLPAPSPRQGGLSRRGLIDLLRPAAAAPATKGRRAVLDLLGRRRATLPADAGLAFRFHAPDGCDGCAVCIRLCPTSALKLVPGDGGDKTLTFATDLCNGCGLCVDVCRPPGARLERVDSPPGLAGATPIELAKLRRKACQRCHAEFFSSAATGPEFCFVCVDRNEEDSS